MSGTATTSPLAVAGARGRRDVSADVARLWLALLVLAAALFANQYVTLRKVKEALLSRAPGEPVASLGQKAWSLIVESWEAFMAPADIAIAATILLAAAYVVRAEVTGGACTALLRQAERSRGVLFGFLALATLAITRSYLNPGQVFMGDAETHMLRGWMFAEHFRRLDSPVWSNAWYGGFPLLEHYGPLYFITTALLTLGVGDIHLATKLLLWGAHAGSVFAMFFFLREVTRRDLPSLVGALAYGLSFHRLHIILYQGDLQVAVLLLLYPVLLFLVERFLAQRRHARRTFVLLTLALAAMILNHHGYAFFGMVLLAVYLVARLAVSPGSVRERLALLVYFGAAQVAAAAISAFLLVPFLFGMDEHRGMPNSAFPILIPNLWGPIMLVKLFRWSAVGDGGSIGYVGLSIGVLAIVGIRYGVKHRIPAVIGLTAGALASLLMVKNQVAYNIKNIDFFMLFVAALPAWALIAVEQSPSTAGVIERARRRWGHRFAARAAVIALALLFLDLGPTTFQSLYRENYEFKQPKYQEVLGVDDRFKIIERQVLTHDPTRSPDAFFDPNKLGIPSAYARTQTPLGFFHEGAGRSFGYNAEMVKSLHRDLNQGRVSELSALGLYLMGVKQVLFRDRYQWFRPDLEPSPHLTLDGDVLRMRHASPLLASTRVITTDDIPGYPSTDIIREGRYLEPETFDYSGRYHRELVEPLIRAMGIDMARGVATTLVARAGEPRIDRGSPDALRVDIEHFTTDLKRVEVRYRSNLSAVGRLPYTYFPYLEVRLDGRPTRFSRSAMNDILVPLPAGAHVITVQGTTSPLQAQMLWVSLAALAGVLLVPGGLFRRLNRLSSHR